MTKPSVSKSSRLGLLTLVGAVSLALSPVSASANPVAKPTVNQTAEIPAKPPGKNTYVLQIGDQQKVIKAKTITVRSGGPKQLSVVFVDGKKLLSAASVSVAIATGNGGNDGATASYSQTTTTTQLPGGGTRTDIDHGNGSSTTIVHDPHGGKNGGTRTTTGTTDSEGNTTTTTTTTDGSDGSSTTTITTSP